MNASRTSYSSVGIAIAYLMGIHAQPEEPLMISGLVIHLSDNAALRRQALADMQRRTGVELGDRMDLRLPVVVESTEDCSAKETAEWVKNLPGVVHADVTFVHLEAEE